MGLRICPLKIIADLRIIAGMQDAHSLPDDLDACHTLIAQQAAALLNLAATREQLSQENQELHLTIQKLLARLRGHRSERSVDPNQQQLDFGDELSDAAVQDGLADAAAEAEQILQEYTVRRRQKKRKTRTEELPAHLPRYEVTAPVPPGQEHCAEHGPRQIIGYDLTETLEFERPKLRVRVTKYPKFVCPDQPQCGVAQPPRPEGLVEGDRYDTSIAAEIIAAKYAYHMPTYRQQDYFAGSGWMPQRSTLLNILTNAAYVLERLYLHYADHVRTAAVIPTDETGVMLLLPPEIPAARRRREVAADSRGAECRAGREQVARLGPDVGLSQPGSHRGERVRLHRVAASRRSARLFKGLQRHVAGRLLLRLPVDRAGQ